MSIISISLSDQEITKVNQLAEENNLSRSQVVKDAIALYDFEQRWRRLRAVGDQIAKRLGIESDDDVERIFG